MQTLADLKIKVFADGADKATLLALNADPLIKGMTTNPTLMNKAGIADYEKFAHEVLSEVKEKPISFEVFSDEFPEMRRQALKISKWQENVYVKIPVTNTRTEPSLPLIRELAREGVRLNITANLTTIRCAMSSRHWTRNFLRSFPFSRVASPIRAATQCL